MLTVDNSDSPFSSHSHLNLLLQKSKDPLITQIPLQTFFIIVNPSNYVNHSSDIYHTKSLQKNNIFYLMTIANCQTAHYSLFTANGTLRGFSDSHNPQYTHCRSRLRQLLPAHTVQRQWRLFHPHYSPLC